MTEQTPEQTPRSPSRNLITLFEQQVAGSGDTAAALYKSGGAWRTLSWNELAAEGRAFADGLCALGVQPGDRVAILGNTNPDWIKAYLGVLGAGAVAVPIYQSDKPNECRHILSDSGASYIFCDTEIQAQKVREIQGELPHLKGIVRFEGPPQNARERTVADLRQLGLDHRRTHEGDHDRRTRQRTEDDAACIIYTSGTTGDPKGVVLTHANWIYETEAVVKTDLLRTDELVLFFLPLAHVFAQVVVACWLRFGFRVAFVESIDKLLDDAGEVHPTVLPAVPRIFEKAFDSVVQRGMATPGVRGKLFRMSMRAFERYASSRKTDGARGGGGVGLWLARRLVFPKMAVLLKERFGGQLRFFISGSAPLSPKIAYFFQELGLTILEGYGLTETSAGTTVNLPGRIKIGTVGPPLPGTELRIAEDGEIWVRGPGVMQGYYRNPAATAEVIQDGWFATGDIGELDAEGFLRITDRKKDIIATAGGKKVAPQNLENELQTTPLISHVVVHGDRRKFLSALVTLNPVNARKFADARGSRAQTLEELAKDPAVRAGVQAAIDSLNQKLPSYSTLKKFAILPVEFSIEGGELTPKLSVRRKVLSERYREILDGFYQEGIAP